MIPLDGHTVAIIYLLYHEMVEGGEVVYTIKQLERLKPVDKKCTLCQGDKVLRSSNPVIRGLEQLLKCTSFTAPFAVYMFSMNVDKTLRYEVVYTFSLYSTCT